MKIRPIAVRIGTGNDGGYMVWGSNTCGGEEGKVTIDDKEYSYYSEHVCTASEDNAWLDLTAGTEAVNAELNSQSWPIPPGDYAWVSIILCAHGTKTDGSTGWIDDSGIATMSYQGGVMTEAVSYTHLTLPTTPYV